MVNFNPNRTPIDTKCKLGDDVQQVCLYMHDPWEPHFLALKRILSAEAKYHGVAETCWLRNLLQELHTPLSSATLVNSDNVSAVYLSSNLEPWISKEKGRRKKTKAKTTKPDGMEKTKSKTKPKS
ncbi:ribonuclease H-like domain-containing protein [Tanacetum coccineum]